SGSRVLGHPRHETGILLRHLGRQQSLDELPLEVAQQSETLDVASADLADVIGELAEPESCSQREAGSEGDSRQEPAQELLHQSPPGGGLNLICGATGFL